MKVIILAGHGIRLHNQIPTFRKFLERTQNETVTTWSGADLLPTDHPQNIGIVGVSGQRGANKAMNEADIIYALGASANIAQLSAIKPKATLIQIHGSELNHFFNSHRAHTLAHPEIRGEPWAYEYKPLNAMPLDGSYGFNARMTKMLPPGCIMVIDGGGTALYTGFQSSHIKEGSRLICSTAISAMGSGLPEAVGASFASRQTIVTCLIGDGSFMLNLQELATIRHYNLPIKVFVLNNGGYLAIRHTQSEHMQSRLHGVDGKDMTLPNTQAIAAAFGIPYCKMREPMEEYLGPVLDDGGPVICEVMTPHDQRMLRQSAGKPLSEMDY